MADEYISVDLITWDIPGVGVVELEDAMTLEVTHGGESTVVFTMRRNRVGKGYRDAPPSFTWTMTAARRKGGDEVDYRDLKKRKVVFQQYVEEGDGGQRRQLVDCRIDEVVPTSNQDGEAEWRISGKALDERRDLANSPLGADLE